MIRYATRYTPVCLLHFLSFPKKINSRISTVYRQRLVSFCLLNKYYNEHRVLGISYFSAYRAHSVRCYTDFDDYAYFLSFLFLKSIGRLRCEIRVIFKFVRFSNIFLLFTVSYFLLRCTVSGKSVRAIRICG